MPTQGTEDGVGAAAKQVGEHASALAKLQIELATIELKRKLPVLAVGIGLGVGALLLVLYAFGFALAGAASGLGNVVPSWAALLIVAGVLLLIAVILAFLAKQRLEQSGGPVPEQAIHEAKVTQEVLQTDVNP
jgi:Flp pilus assembly protein TadB